MFVRVVLLLVPPLGNVAQCNEVVGMLPQVSRSRED
jgi:hypothetical protein